MTTRGAIYARISKDRVGAGLGVERQHNDCEILAQQLDVDVVKLHQDNDLSAYSGKPRPGYRALLNDIAAGTIDLVLCWHTDRLHRSPAELEEWILACEPRGVAVHTVKAGPLDLATPSGRMVARQLGAVARYEVEHMIERQQAAKAQAAAQGKYRGGRRPFGYESDGKTVEPSEARLVAEMTRATLNGQSLHSIATDMNSAGHRTSTGKAWTARAVRQLVIRPRNAGFVEHAGNPEAATAEWSPLVDVDTWRSVRSLVLDPGRKHPVTMRERFLGSGLFRCGVCADGTTMLTATTQGAGRRQRPAYRCRAGYHLTRMAEPVDELVSQIVIERLSRPDAKLLLHEPAEHVNVQELHDRANTIRGRMAEAGRMFGSGQITGDQLQAATATAQHELDGINGQLARAVAGTPLDGFANADDVQQAWDDASVGRRKNVVDALMTVTLTKAPRGRRPDGGYFDPSSIRIDWKAP